MAQNNTVRIAPILRYLIVYAFTAKRSQKYSLFIFLVSPQPRTHTRLEAVFNLARFVILLHFHKAIFLVVAVGSLSRNQYPDQIDLNLQSLMLSLVKMTLAFVMWLAASLFAMSQPSLQSGKSVCIGIIRTCSI